MSGSISTASVPTVRGMVPATALGRTLTHEHLFVLDAEYALNYMTDSQIAAMIDAAASKLEAARRVGVDSIVDLTVHGVGRMMSWITQLAERVDINILVSTGFYVTGELPRMFGVRGPGTLMGGPDPMTELLIADLTSGIGPSGVRAALIKCVTEEMGVTAAVRRAMQAVADAHLETGAPISTHAHAGTRRGLDQQHFLERRGVDLSRVVIGHAGDSDDLDYLQELLRRGSYVGLDRFGYRGPLSLQQRIDTVVRLCEKGWTEKLLLSHDAACHMTWMDDEVRAQVAPLASFTFLSDAVVPELRARGLGDNEIDQIFVGNPGRFLPCHSPRAAGPVEAMSLEGAQ